MLFFKVVYRENKIINGSVSQKGKQSKTAIFNQCAMAQWCATNSPQVCHWILRECSLLIRTIGECDPHANNI